MPPRRSHDLSPPSPRPAIHAAAGDAHPAFFVIDLMGAIANRCPADQTAASDMRTGSDELLAACLLRVACVEGLPVELQDLARRAYPRLAPADPRAASLTIFDASTLGH